MRKWFIGAVTFALGSVNALAADMPVYRPPPRYIPPPVISWTGFYLGVNAGYSWGVSPFVTPAQNMTMLTVGPPEEATLAATAAMGPSLRFRYPAGSFVGGMQMGFNWQASNGLVAGIETDAQGFGTVMQKANNVTMLEVVGTGTQIGTIATATRSLDFIGTLRGRIGFLVTPSFMIYGTGGLAYGSVRASYGFTQSLYGADGVTFNPGSWGGQSSYAALRAGWTMGLGTEWMFYPGVTFKSEYLYYSLGSHATPTFGVLDPTNVAFDPAWSNLARSYTRFNGHIFRVGVNYLFNDSGPPNTVFSPRNTVYARY